MNRSREAATMVCERERDLDIATLVLGRLQCLMSGLHTASALILGKDCMLGGEPRGAGLWPARRRLSCVVSELIVKSASSNRHHRHKLEAPWPLRLLRILLLQHQM